MKTKQPRNVATIILGTFMLAEYFVAGNAFAATKVITPSDLTVLGSFKVPQDDGSSNANTLSYNGYGLAFNPAGNGGAGSLFISGYRGYGRVAEINIPTLVTGSNLSALNRATFIKGLTDPTGGNLGKIDAGGGTYANGEVDTGGLLVFNGRLIGTAFGYYDANHEAVRSHFVSSLTLSNLGGMYGLTGAPQAGYLAGPMAIMPAEYQASLGGKAITFCRTPSQNPGRSSYGPAAFAFDPDTLTGSPSDSKTAVVPLLYYDDINHPNATWGDYNSVSTQYSSLPDEIPGVVFPVNTKSILYFGRHGTGANCYGDTIQDGKGTCNDPTYPDTHGDHAYPYSYWLWVYNVDDFIAVKNGVKNPWSILPSVYNLDSLLPIAGGYHIISGAAYDPATQRIYLLVDHGEAPYPIVTVLQINAPIGGGTVDTTPPAAPRGLAVH
jgi:hypothetical protein